MARTPCAADVVMDTRHALTPTKRGCKAATQTPQSPPGPRLGDAVIEDRHLFSGHHGPVSHPSTSPSSCRPAASLELSAERCWQDDACRTCFSPKKEKPDPGRDPRRRHGELRHAPTRAARSIPTRMCGGPHFRPRGRSSRSASARAHSRADVPAFTSGGSDQQSRSASSRGAGERTACIWGQNARKSGANVLLLSTSRPTTLTPRRSPALEAALEDFAGCAIVIKPRPHVPRPPRDPHPSPSRATATSSGSRALRR